MRTRHYRPLVLLMALTLFASVFAAAACGGSDGATVTTAPDAQTTVAGNGGSETAAGTSGNVAVKGLADNPMTLTAAALETMTVAEITVDHPKLGLTDYRGVRLSELFKTLGVKEIAAEVAMIASDGYMVQIPLADVQASADAMLAIGEDGTLTVVIPGMESKNWVKDVVSIDFK